MKSFVAIPIAFISILVVLLLSTASFAAEQGAVTGQIIDPTNNIKLVGVLVTSDGNAQKAVSDKKGEYRLVLAAGRHILTFSYLGYETVTSEVAVTANTTTTRDIDLSSDSFTLGEVVVKGQAIGQARALNVQMNAANLVDVSASDAFGRFPDQNAAEALSRLPGLSVQRDQGEGRYVVIRGINPELNSVAIDGVQIPAAEDSSRAVLLDALPLNDMETLSVSKSLTPDMPANAIGGSINIETPSAFDRNQRTLRGTLAANYSSLTSDAKPDASLTYGDVFGAEGRIGFLVSLGYDERSYGSDGVETGDPWEMDENGNWVSHTIEFREYNLTRKRYGGTFNLEFKPSDKNLFYLRGLYAQFVDHEKRQRTVIDDADAGLGSGADMDSAKTLVYLKDREEKQGNWFLSTGAEQEFDGWDIDYSLAYSMAEQDTPDDSEIGFQTKDLSYSYSDVTSDTPSVQVTDGDAFDLSSYELKKLKDKDQDVQEKAWTLQANLKKDLGTTLPTYLKGGIYVKLGEKTNDIEVFDSDGNPADFDTLDGNATLSGRNTYSDFPMVAGDTVERFRDEYAAFAESRNAFDSAVEDYTTDEDVYAGYLLGNVDFGNVSVMPGARYEYTELEATGNIVDEGADDPLVGSDTKSHHYGNILPSVNVRATLGDNLILHGAWTNSLSRPSWDQVRYSRSIDEDGNVEVGNPDLDPYKSMNWDANLALYGHELGMASAGVFYKKVEQFIYSRTTYNDDDTSLTTFQNGDDGHIAGLELAGRLMLSTLTPALEGFSILANATFSDSEATVMPAEGGDSRTVDFVGNSKTVGNIALSFEKYDFFARLSGVYRSSYLDELGDEPFEDRYIDDHVELDLSLAYTFSEHYTVFADFINLTDEPLRAYWGESGRISQNEVYDWSAKAGLKFNF